MQRLLIKVLFVICPFVTKVQSQTEGEKSPYHPLTKDLLSAKFLDKFTKDINEKIPSIGSFIICQHDTLLYEQYFHTATNTTLFNIKSITKSIVSALAGIAQEKGLLPDLQTPVLDILTDYKPKLYSDTVWFSGLRKESDSIRQTVTVRDILTMQTGMQWDDFGPVATAFVLSSDPVKFMLDIPFSDNPGQTFNYCSGAASLLCAVLSKLVKQDLKDFANYYLFNPIDVQLNKWSKDPTGRYVGASEIYLTTQDLVKFGLLYMHDGKMNGSQIISKRWIKESLSEQVSLHEWPVLPNVNGYGYYWWRRKSFEHQCYVASGAGGQLIYVIPELDLVIATNCFLNENNRGRSEIKVLHSFVDIIIRKIKNGRIGN